MSLPRPGTVHEAAYPPQLVVKGASLDVRAAAEALVEGVE